ncbi:hypothetical protein GCM10011579_067640 [Streptomyces albiflavescens]|uniref:Uncharacterized protein n=1 Tax=Streptomyces albiflavescens TaxID=1623582 RepID=A0A918D8M4_9ACTN|nr:hypothetical protein GCM10011579_067640 [Streptomyces albiflavescens]
MNLTTHLRRRNCPPELTPPSRSPDNDPQARENVNEAQFEQAELLEDDEFEQDYDNTFAGEEGERFDDPARIVHGWR